MLSYRHAFHAGNFADVLKHLVQSQILRYMIQKDKPLWYGDTHAGAGGYALSSAEAKKNAEFMTGIGLLWPRADVPDMVADYVELVRQFNHQAGSAKDLAFYPGSPWFARQLLRDEDRLGLFELHPKDSQALIAATRGDRRIRVQAKDGYQGLIASLPPKERRGLILIDPPYELKTDYDTVVETLVQAYKRFATGTYALWYPVVQRSRVQALEKALVMSGMRHIELYELAVAPDTSGRGMTASGMIVINPPWTLQSQMQACLPWLADVLAGQAGSYRIETLVEE